MSIYNKNKQSQKRLIEKFIYDDSYKKVSSYRKGLGYLADRHNQGEANGGGSNSALNLRRPSAMTTLGGDYTDQMAPKQEDLKLYELEDYQNTKLSRLTGNDKVFKLDPGETGKTISIAASSKLSIFDKGNPLHEKMALKRPSLVEDSYNLNLSLITHNLAS